MIAGRLEKFEEPPFEYSKFLLIFDNNVDISMKNEYN